MSLRKGMITILILSGYVLMFWMGVASEKNRYKTAFNGESIVRMYGSWYMPIDERLNNVCGKELTAELGIKADYEYNADATCERCH